MLAMERCLMSKQRRTFSPEFKQQAACLVLDQGYSHVEASRSIGVGESLMRRWVQQLQLERQGVTPQGKAITPDQQRIQELEARIERLEREKSILKNRPTRLPVPLMNRNSRRVHWTRAGTVAVSFLEARPRQKTWPWESCGLICGGTFA